MTSVVTIDHMPRKNTMIRLHSRIFQLSEKDEKKIIDTKCYVRFLNEHLVFDRKCHP